MASPPTKHFVRSVSSIAELSAKSWNACANPNPKTYNPFVSYHFLNALEKSKSVCKKTGWMPCHLALSAEDTAMQNSEENNQDTILGVMPCYIKSHSYGEYIFDHAWAELYMRLHKQYYPKLQCAIPFTPATGPRLLTPANPNQKKHQKSLAAAAIQLVEKLDISSFHCTFLNEQEHTIMSEMGFLTRHSQQFHWHNNAYKTFDEFLATLSSRKRKTIRKERREAQNNNITIKWLTGSDLQENHWDHFYEFYLDTSSRKWGQAYLTREFFSHINETMRDQILLILCHRGDKIIAGALNFIGGDTLYGRNWGAIEDHKFLHFEACYYQAIDFAIQNGLSRVEAGAQGAHKLARGYVPTLTYSTHYITNPELRHVIARYLEHEKDHIAFENNILSTHTPYAQKPDVSTTCQRTNKND
ncbi:MAG: GNAT family N-acetyltransferase [Pseudomonadota bacterium]